MTLNPKKSPLLFAPLFACGVLSLVVMVEGAWNVLLTGIHGEDSLLGSAVDLYYRVRFGARSIGDVPKHVNKHHLQAFRIAAIIFAVAFVAGLVIYWLAWGRKRNRPGC